MTRKLLVPASLLLFALPALAQTPATQPVTSSTDASTPLKIGGDVLPPVLISSIEPEFKRPLFHKAKPGIVVVGLTVPVDGVPADVHIIKSSGSTFDKNSLIAVRQYRFRPATQNGKPVATQINIEVQFKVF